MSVSGPARASAGFVKIAGCSGICSYCGVRIYRLGISDLLDWVTYVTFSCVETVIEAYAVDNGCPLQGAEELCRWYIRTAELGILR